MRAPGLGLLSRNYNLLVNLRSHHTLSWLRSYVRESPGVRYNWVASGKLVLLELRTLRVKLPRNLFVMQRFIFCGAQRRVTTQFH